MEEVKYCIFQIFDYKGGELVSQVNLSEEEFISSLSESFEYMEDLNENSTLREIEKAVEEEIESEYFESVYAGGEGFCGELYEIKNGKLKPTTFKKYVKLIAKYIKNH